MQIVLNGQSTEIEVEGVSALLESIGIDPSQPGVAIAVNERVLPRVSWTVTTLSEGDRVEIITAMQGG